MNIKIFFLPKKKRYSSTPTLSRPTVKEINEIEKDVESAEVKFCGGCLKEDTTTVDAIEWIHCDAQCGYFSIAHNHN